MKLSALLNELIEVEYDALSGSRAAAARLQNLESRTQVREIAESHACRVAQVSEMVRDLGGAAWTSACQTLVFSKAKVVFAQSGGNRAVLRALRDSERGIVAAYALVLLRPLAARVAMVLEANQRTALGHFQWLDARIVESSPKTGIVLRFPTVSLEEKR